MPLSHDHIRTTVETYLARHPHERAQLGGLLAALDRPTAIAGRSTFTGHVTCGAIVVDPLGRVLHVLHLASGKFLAPGGHTEPVDESLAAAALRELHEETGIPPQAVAPWPGYETVPFDIDTHDIDAHPGKGEPGHQHFDLRFLFRLHTAVEVPMVPQEEEVGGIEWRPMNRVASPSLRDKLLKLPTETETETEPEPAHASALIYNDRGEYLLHLRDYFPGRIREPGMWSLLGGGREPQDATLEHTVRRELAEEAGLDPTELAPFDTEYACDDTGARVPIAVYAGRWNGDPRDLRLTEGVMLAWFTPDDLHRLRIADTTSDLVRRHAAGRPTDTARSGRSSHGKRRPLNPDGHREDPERGAVQRDGLARMTGTPSGAHRRPSTATAAGREDTRLVVIRGNSASGKSSVAQGLRDHYGRGIAIVGQDVIRRNVLREHDTARGANIALLGRIAREALNAGFHVVLEGILYADRYSHMITSLVRDHRGVSCCYYLDVPLETTFVRHASKADAAYLAHVTDRHLASWYRELDLLPGGLETVVPADSTLPDTVARILRETDLTSASPVPPPRCKPSQGDSMNDPVLMSDPRVAAIPVRECGEPLVDVRDHGIRVDPRKQDPVGAFAHVREGVLARLERARSLLPAGTDLLFIEGYRPLARQEQYFTQYRDELAAAHPDWTTERLHQAASRYVSPPQIAPHSAGAAVDVTLVDQDGNELDLGARVNASPEESDGACFTHAPNLSDRARHHRTLLLHAMESAGFTNYGTEFWHFSAADRYDALMRHEPHARYGTVELP
jgi:D-alanyl-D-alanine dipeptidase/8-oxo-dGTP pyrophosphatase MutT (NUDIX family)/predicted kinase